MIGFKLASYAEHVRPEIEYVLKVWAKNQGQEIAFDSIPSSAITIGDETSGLAISQAFQHAPNALYKPEALDVKGKYLLENAFRLLNCLQEYDPVDRDELGRFTFKSSYQSRLHNHTENVVQNLFDEISRRVGLTPASNKSKFLLTHDIDLVYGAILEDGFHVLKKGRIDLFLRMLLNLAIGKPEWLNMDKIMQLESAYDCRSTFFWIVNKGKLNKRERNADYTFNTSGIQHQFKSVANNKFENGIHKSLSPETFVEEFKKYGTKPLSNRYHYLKFNLPKAFHDIEESGLKLDSSLGFAEEIGFRNSYGLPFNPYNFRQRLPFSFVEAPLHVMDRTFFQYKRSSPANAQRDILDFFEKNKNNCVLNVLWHNNFFTDYKFKGYLDIYKNILAYIRENNFETTNTNEIVKNYSIAP